MKAIFDDAYRKGEAAGYRQGYDAGWNERDGLALIASQPAAAPRG